MVSPASQRVLRARWYSGYRGIVCTLSNTGLSPSTAGLSRLVLLEIHFCNYLELLPHPYSVLQHPLYNAGRLSRIKGFGLFPVRSPLLRELFLFFGVLRCFSSPTCLSSSQRERSTRPSRRGVAPFGDLRIGLSAAPRSFSQRNHVLLRPWLPRHPPYALIRL